MTCQCVPCEFDFDVCPVSADTQRGFNVTVYDNLGDPTGRITGEFSPNGGGGVYQVYYITLPKYGIFKYTIKSGLKAGSYTISRVQLVIR